MIGPAWSGVHADPIRNQGPGRQTGGQDPALSVVERHSLGAKLTPEGICIPAKIKD